MGQGMGNGKGQRLLPITGCPDVDPRRDAHRRIAPVRRHDKARAQAFPVAQRHAGLPGAGEQRGSAGAGAEIDIGHGAKLCQQFAAQQPVGQVPSKGGIGDIGGIKITDHAGRGISAARVDDPHDLQRRGVRGIARPKPAILKLRAGRLQEGRGAQIRAVGLTLRDRGRGIDTDHIEPRRAKGHRRCHPGNATAGDQNIACLGHDPSAIDGKSRPITGAVHPQKGAARRNGGLLPHPAWLRSQAGAGAPVSRPAASAEAATMALATPSISASPPIW